MLINNIPISYEVLTFMWSKDGFWNIIWRKSFGNLLFDTYSKKSAPNTIVNLLSNGHFGIKWNDLQSVKSFSSFNVYRQSKLAMILITKELAERKDS